MKNKSQITTMSVNAIGSYGLLKLPQSTIDPYTRSVTGMLIGFGLVMAGAITKNKFLIWSGVGVSVGGAITLEEVGRLKGGKIVSNQYTKSIFVLHETESVKELKPNEIPNFRIDGITIKGMNGVFKVHNSVYLKILPNGIINTTFGVGKFVNCFGAGYMPKNWVDAQTDKRWLTLYKKSL